MHGGFVIQLQQCPRCGIHRTTRRIDRSRPSFCFNCKLQFTPPAEQIFDPLQLARMLAYRAAVQAGFYNDYA